MLSLKLQAHITEAGLDQPPCITPDDQTQIIYKVFREQSATELIHNIKQVETQRRTPSVSSQSAQDKVCLSTFECRACNPIFNIKAAVSRLPARPLYVST